MSVTEWHSNFLFKIFFSVLYFFGLKRDIKRTSLSQLEFVNVFIKIPCLYLCCIPFLYHYKNRNTLI